MGSREKNETMTKWGLVVIASLLAATLGGCCLGRGQRQTTETITIAGPGFTPDPTTTSGQAGGNMEASSLVSVDAMGGGCTGSIPAMPQHTVHLDAALPVLRILVNGSEDTTLVVRTPTGAYYCNDDSGDPNHGLNPVVEIPGATAGDYSVYVGAFGDSAMLSTYSIGFTATMGTYPSQVVR